MILFQKQSILSLKMKSKFIKYIILASVILTIPIHADTTLIGGGATFPYPLYEKVFKEFYKKKNIKINYQPIGSGAGISQLQNKTLHFAGTDTFITEKNQKQFTSPIIHIPICLGAVAVAYNLPQIKTLKLSSDVLALIFRGKITKWNDQKIKELNPKEVLPNLPITVVHRSDSSGTTFIFSEFLSKTNTEWRENLGKGSLIKWPTGIGTLRNTGVTKTVKQIKGAIGYMELVYALNSGLGLIKIQNKSGNFITPSLESTSMAANTPFPKDTYVTLTDTTEPKGYPISSVTWIVTYKEINKEFCTEDEFKALVQLLSFFILEAQENTNELGYAKLPKDAVKRAQELIKTLSYKN